MISEEKAVNQAEIFGDNIPSRLIYVSEINSKIKSGKLKSGTKIAQFISVYWENEEKVTELIEADSTEGLNFKLPAKIGSFFSLSWAISDEILRQYAPSHIISLGFNDIKFEPINLGDQEIFGNIYLVKGKQTEKKSCKATIYEGRLQVSFNMSEMDIMWKSATRGWIDIVFSNPKFKKLKVMKPMIWIQSRLSL